MGKTKSSLHPDNLTVSRIHVVLRPFETKLNALAKTLERRVAKDTFAPKSRQPGVTYAKRHRIRAMTGMSSRQAGRAYVLEKKKGLSTLYSFHEQVIGVEDAFANLVKGIPTPDQQRIPTLGGIIAKKVGEQVAEETMRDKEELEAEGIVDCIGLWYGELPVHARKDALVSHAVQLLELKIPVFILELWEGLLSVTLQARLHQESGTLLEHIILGYFTPFNDEKHASDCPAASASGRDLTDLYKRYTAHLPPADFLSVFLPILENAPPAVWNFRCVSHLLRHLDSDFVLTARFLECMAGACLQADHDADTDRWIVELLETKAYGFLRSIIEVGHNSFGPEEIREMDYLTSTMMLIRLEWAEHNRIDEITLALNAETLLQATEYHPTVDISDIVSRLSNLSDAHIASITFSALFSVSKVSRDTFTSFMDPYLSAFRKHRLFDLANRLMALMDKHSGSKGASPVEFDVQSVKKRRRKVVQSRNKRRKLENGSYSATGRNSSASEDGNGENDRDSEESDSDLTSQWDNSTSGEDTAGEAVSDNDLTDRGRVHNSHKGAIIESDGRKAVSKSSREQSYRTHTSESRSTTATRYSTETGDDGEWKENENEDENEDDDEDEEDSEGTKDEDQSKNDSRKRASRVLQSRRRMTSDTEDETTDEDDEIALEDDAQEADSITQEEEEDEINEDQNEKEGRTDEQEDEDEEDEDEQQEEQDDDEDEMERSLTPRPARTAAPKGSKTPRRSLNLSPSKKRLVRSLRSDSATDPSSPSDSRSGYDGYREYDHNSQYDYDYDFGGKFTSLPLTYKFAPPRLQSVLMSKVGAGSGVGSRPGHGTHVRTRVPIRIPTPVKHVRYIIPMSGSTHTRNLRSMPSSDDDLDLLGHGSSP